MKVINKNCAQETKINQRSFVNVFHSQFSDGPLLRQNKNR